MLQEQSLDPQNWDAFRSQAHTVLDDMINHLKNIRSQLVWQPTNETVRDNLNQKAPAHGSDLKDVYKEFTENILPYNIGNIHPRFWGWVMGTGTPTGMLADMMASAMNCSPSFGDHADVYVEAQVINWVKEIFGLNQHGSGLLTTGASIANIMCLTIARNHHLKDVRLKGMAHLTKPLTIYGSSETHSCLTKAVELIGIGREYLRKIPVDDYYRIRIDLLEQKIEQDKADGLQPFCIIGNAGTVNTGAFDDLKALAAIAERENIWFHIDGAFGIVPKILPEFSNTLKGVDRADSIAFDFHKWFYVNYDAGCFIIKNSDIHKESFNVEANYLLTHERGMSSGTHNPHLMGLELSRGFRALKIWMMFKEIGLSKYQELIRQNLKQAQYLAALVGQEENLQLLAPVPLNIVCFRYFEDSCTLEELNEINKEILMQLHESGLAAPSYTILKGKYAIRVCITNHRTKTSDLDFLVNKVITLGKKLLVAS